MEEIISKELLSEVLEKKVEKYQLWNSNIIKIFIEHPEYDGYYETIGIHDLIGKCIDYITNLENSPITLCSHDTFYITTDGSEWYSGYAHIKSTYDDKQTVKDECKADTFNEVVIKHAQWILDNKANK